MNQSTIAKKRLKQFFVKTTLLSLICFSISALADAKDTLQTRLNKVNSFQASFKQKVFDANRSLIQEGEGDVWLKRPNLFRWHTLVPDESLLVSDGETLWFYNPFIEQVTATYLNNATSNTPFKLIASNQNSDWQQYEIKQKGNNFSLKPKANDSNIKSFEINVNNAGLIDSFTVEELDGQRIEYSLSQQNSSVFKDDIFKFTMPEGVAFDDQR